MPKIVFDLDGVLRDLMFYLSRKYDVPIVDNWYWKHNKKDIFDWVDYDKKKVLALAPVTEYYKTIIDNFDFIEIWTCQPKEWMPYTNFWIDAHLKDFIDYKIKIMNTKEKEEALYKSKDTYLVEDCPRFKNYDRILLLDRSYNKDIKVKYRIHSPALLLPTIADIK